MSWTSAGFQTRRRSRRELNLTMLDGLMKGSLPIYRSKLSHLLGTFQEEPTMDPGELTALFA